MSSPSSNGTTLQKAFKTIFLVLVWVCLGLFLEVTGPTLIDLKNRINSNYETVSTAVSGRSVGYFIGTVIGGLLVDRYGKFCELMIAVSLDGGALATVALPWVPKAELIWFLSCVQGTFEGVINIAGPKLIFDMWQKNSASPLHIMHGGFGVGSFIIPLIANPFLAIPARKDDDNSTNTGSQTTQQYFGTISSSQTDVTTPALFSTADEDQFLRPSRIEYAYLISAIITAALSVVFYTYHVAGVISNKDKDKNDANVTPMEVETENGNKSLALKQMFNPATCAGGNVVYGIQIFALLFLYMFNCFGGERVAGKFVRAFSIDKLGFSTDDGSYINTTYWISLSVGRFVGFIAARWISIRKLILIETSGVLVTAICMVIFCGNSSTALWVLTQPMGFFTGPIIPSAVAWGNYHVQMTGVAITVILLGGSVGGVVYMKLIGYLYDKYGPSLFLYILLGFGIATFVLSIILDIVGTLHGGRFFQNVDDTTTADVNKTSDTKCEN